MYLAQYAQTHLQRDSGSARTVSFQYFQGNPLGRGQEADYPSGGKTDKRQMHFALTPEGKSRITVIKNSTPEIPPLLQEIV